jgi:phage-related protein (TIGR01555 family)
MKRSRRSVSKTRSSRNDGVVNRVSGHGTSRDRRTFTTHELDIVTDLDALTMWRSDDILSRIAEARPFDAWRRGLEVMPSEDGKELGDAMSQEMTRLEMAERFKMAGAMENALGGSAILPIFKNDMDSFEEPLADPPSNLGVVALHVLQPRELIPVEWYSDIEDPRFRFPSVYQFVPVSVLGSSSKSMTGVRIHESRLIIWDGFRAVPHHVLGQRIGWGDSKFFRVRQVAADFGLSWGSAATLLHDFGQSFYAMDGLHDTLARKGGRQVVRDRLDFMDEFRSTIRATLVDGKDKFGREAVALSGYADLLMQLAQRVAAAAEMPVTRLMGMSPAGLNATGESDMRTWYDTVEVERRRIDPKARKLLRMLWCQANSPTEGEEPERWSTLWPPLWQPTAKEQAETRYLIAEADKIYAIDIGSVKPSTITESRWGGDSFSEEMHVDDDEIKAMKDLEKEQATAAEELRNNPPPPVVVQPGQPGDPAAVTDPAAETAPPKPPANGKAAPPRKPARRTDEDISGDIARELGSDYPPEALGWIRAIPWSDSQRVPIDQIDFSNSDSWGASKEQEKVDKFAERIVSGWEKPILLVRKPGSDKLMVVDGHHRALAYKQTGRDPLAFVGEAPKMSGPWDDFHDSQRDKTAKDAARADARIVH